MQLLPEAGPDRSVQSRREASDAAHSKQRSMSPAKMRLGMLGTVACLADETHMAYGYVPPQFRMTYTVGSEGASRGAQTMPFPNCDPNPNPDPNPDPDPEPRAHRTVVIFAEQGRGRVLPSGLLGLLAAVQPPGDGQAERHAHEHHGRAGPGLLEGLQLAVAARRFDLIDCARIRKRHSMKFALDVARNAVAPADA